MPRYHFRRMDGKDEPDPDGSELADLTVARTEAVIYAGQSLKDHPEMLWIGHEMKIEVSDEAGSILFVVTVMTSESRPGKASARGG